MESVTKSRGISLLVFLLSFNSKNTSAQCTFYTDNGKTPITEINGAQHQDITVTIAIPNDIVKYDSYTIDAHLSSIKNFARVDLFKDKKLKSQYKGKKEITLLLISADGKNSDFTFGYDGVKLSDKDVCKYPSKERIAKFDITVKASGWEIVNYTDVSELVYGSNPPRYVTNHYPVWDSGTDYAEGKLVVLNATKSKFQYFVRHYLAVSILGLAMATSLVLVTTTGILHH